MRIDLYVVNVNFFKLAAVLFLGVGGVGGGGGGGGVGCDGVGGGGFGGVVAVVVVAVVVAVANLVVYTLVARRGR